MSEGNKSIFGVDVELVGTDGNAFALLGACKLAASRADIDKSKVDEFLQEAMKGDYDHLLRTCMKYFNVN
tara:strand:+ start:314 stop:523 length:210 start_codon:yes stop_codon:yes gene_type:complete